MVAVVAVRRVVLQTLVWVVGLLAVVVVGIKWLLEHLECLLFHLGNLLVKV